MKLQCLLSVFSCLEISYLFISAFVCISNYFRSPALDLSSEMTRLSLPKEQIMAIDYFFPFPTRKFSGNPICILKEKIVVSHAVHWSKLHYISYT